MYMSEDKKSLINLVPDSVDNAIKNITDKPTQNMGTTLADIWYLVFGGISQAADKRKLKYSYALKKFEKELQDEFSKIPKNKRVEPDIQVIAPALEAAKFCVEKERLRKMFAKLITSSLNEDLYDYVHPLFNVIIANMSVFDAMIFDIIYHNNITDFIKLLEDNINSVPQIIFKISSSLTMLHNFGIISGIKYFEENIYHNNDIFCPDNIYNHILNTLQKDYKFLYDKYNGYFNIFHDNWTVSLDYDSINDILYIFKLTNLGENLGKCCYEQ